MRVALALLIVPVVAVLAGCSKPDEDAAAAPSTTPTPVAATSTAPMTPATTPPPAANPDVSAGGTATKANELGPQ